jgi:hypothetical protein
MLNAFGCKESGAGFGAKIVFFPGVQSSRSGSTAKAEAASMAC